MLLFVILCIVTLNVLLNVLLHVAANMDYVALNRVMVRWLDPYRSWTRTMALPKGLP